MLLKRLFTDKLGFAFVHYSLQPSYKTLQMIENCIYTGKKIVNSLRTQRVFGPLRAEGSGNH